MKNFLPYFISVSLFATVICFSSCDKENEVGLSEIRLDMPSSLDTNPHDTTFRIHPLTYYKFNKANYPGYTSFRFMVNTVRTYLPSSGKDTSGTCTIELYDLTHAVPLYGSIISSDDTTYLISGNFMNELPDSDIDLTVRMKNDEYYLYSVYWSAYLIISQ